MEKAVFHAEYVWSSAPTQFMPKLSIWGHILGLLILFKYTIFALQAAAFMLRPNKRPKQAIFYIFGK